MKPAAETNVMNAALSNGTAPGQLERTLAQLTDTLLGELNGLGYWEGELSSSALSTAVATIALRQMELRSGDNSHRSQIAGGLQWLAANQNSDGGWGDTSRSKSNISTTALCWAAFGACQADERYGQTVSAGEAWLARAAGSIGQLSEAIARRYGDDRTFSVPILMAR